MSDEPVKFTVVRTSDAAKKEVSISTSSTKLLDLKRILAEDECFGPKEAPVRRQRIFHLGRELKSGGRSLCNLGLGRFNNRIIHLCIRPNLGKDEIEREEEDNNDPPTNNTNGCGSRKRRRAEGVSEEHIGSSLPSSSSSPAIVQQPSSHQQLTNSNENSNAPIEAFDLNGFSNDQSLSAAPANNHTNLSSNQPIDLLESSDDDSDNDDDVEIIEIS